MSYYYERPIPPDGYTIRCMSYRTYKKYFNNCKAIRNSYDIKSRSVDVLMTEEQAKLMDEWGIKW